MTGSWKADVLPRYRDAIRRLTEQHRELVDEPLHLAIFYQPATRDEQGVFLFEVIGRTDRINPDRDLFEIAFASSSGFPMGPDEELHLVLTNPRELGTALAERWTLASEVVNAIRAGDYEVVYKDEEGERVLAALEVESRRQVAACG